MQSSIKKKLDNMEETPHHEHVDHDMAHLIQKARQDKEWTQKDLGMVVLVYPNLTAFSLNRTTPFSTSTRRRRWCATTRMERPSPTRH